MQQKATCQVINAYVIIPGPSVGRPFSHSGPSVDRLRCVSRFAERARGGHCANPDYRSSRGSQ